MRAGAVGADEPEAAAGAVVAAGDGPGVGRRVQQRFRALLGELRGQHGERVEQGALGLVPPQARARRLQVGAGVAGVGAGAQQVPAALGGDVGQLPGQHEVGELGLRVAQVGAVAAALPLEVVEVDPAVGGGSAAHRGDPGCGGGQEQREQTDGEGERPEEVAAELELEAVGGGHPGGRGHHARVVEQQVERGAVGDEPVRKRLDGGQVREVDAADLDPGPGVLGQDLGAGLLALGGGADGQDDLGTGLGEAAGGFLAGAAVGAGDDGEFSGQVGHGVHGGLLRWRAGPPVKDRRSVAPPKLADHRSDNNRPRVCRVVS
ncbi:hypothetical protein SMICM17S_13081 [Streptomyces microflavus]